jgi:tetratricopeptide (TPR) repeat protein
MNPQLEKFKQDFIIFQNNPDNPIAFFTSIWVPVLLLPREEVKTFYATIYEWAEHYKTGKPQIFALATFSLGFINFHSEKYDEALKYFGKAEKLFTEQNDEDGISICNSSYGGTYRALGNIDLALKYLNEAFYQLSKTHTYKIFENICSYGLASVYLEIKSNEKAIEAYKACIDISIKYNNTNFEMLSYGSLGEAYHNLKQDETALEYFNKALEIGKTLNNKNFYSRVLTDIASFYFDRDELGKAIQYNTEALNYREELNMLGGTITNLLLFVRIHQRQNDLESAIATLNKAMKIAEELKVKPKIFQIHLLLSQIYEGKGELKQSFEHFKLYQKISEEVYKEDGEKKLQRSEMIFEAEQTKKENAIIKAQKLLIEKTNITLQKTIDELTLSKINRKAKTITTTIAILLLLRKTLYYIL